MSYTKLLWMVHGSTTTVRYCILTRAHLLYRYYIEFGRETLFWFILLVHEHIQTANKYYYRQARFSHHRILTALLLLNEIRYLVNVAIRQTIAYTNTYVTYFIKTFTLSSRPCMYSNSICSICWQRWRRRRRYVTSEYNRFHFTSANSRVLSIE